MPGLTLDTHGLTLGGDFTWLVPGLAISVPGMVIVAAGGAQAAGGLLWLPVVKRRLGSLRPRRRGGSGR